MEKEYKVDVVVAGAGGAGLAAAHAAAQNCLLYTSDAADEL